MKKSLIWTLSGVAAVGLAGTGIATWALLQPQAPAAPSADKPVEGIVVDAADVPALYTGDELEWLIPTDDVLAEVVGAGGFDETQAAYGNVGESEGFGANPEECSALIFEDFAGVIGQRSRRFSTADGGGSIRVLQFGSPEAAAAWATPQIDVGADCSSFEWGQFYGEVDEVIAHYTYAVLADDAEPAGGADARVMVQRFDIAETGEWDDDSISATMIYGNTVTILTVGFRDSIDIDADAVAGALRAQAGTAHENLAAALR